MFKKRKILSGNFQKVLTQESILKTHKEEGTEHKIRKFRSTKKRRLEEE